MGELMIKLREIVQPLLRAIDDVEHSLTCFAENPPSKNESPDSFSHKKSTNQPNLPPTPSTPHAHKSRPILLKLLSPTHCFIMTENNVLFFNLLLPFGIGRRCEWWQINNCERRHGESKMIIRMTEIRRTTKKENKQIRKTPVPPLENHERFD